MRPFRLGILVAACLGSLMLGSRADAQSRPEPAAIERTIPRPVTAPRAAPANLSIAREEPRQAPELGRFTLGAVNVDGATVFTERELSQLFEPYLASQVDGGQLATMAAKITERYRHNGYLLSYALVPTQHVEAGMVRLTVVEGRLGAVTVHGAGSDQSAVEAIASPLLHQLPLKSSTLERAIGLIRDYPGLTVTDVAMERSETDPGLYALKITVARDRARAFAYLDNRGSQSIGRLRYFSTLSLSSLVIGGDELRADLFAMPGRRFRYVYGQLFAGVPIGRHGVRFAVAASKGDQYLHKVEHLDGDSTNLSGLLSYPLVRGRALTVVGKAVLNDWRSYSNDHGTAKLRDRVRVARLLLEFSHESRTALQGDISVSQGLGFGKMTKVGDPLASRPDASGRFTKIAFNLQAVRPLSGKFHVQATLAGQYSKRPLLSAEEFALGGNRLGRAFEFNAETADRGIAGGVEVSYRLASPVAAIANPSLFAFIDGGAVFEAKSPNVTDRRRALASVGAGGRFSVVATSFSAEAGVPVVARGQRKSVRLFFSAVRAF